MADLSKLRQRIADVLDEHNMDEHDTCKCEPGFIQGHFHVADEILDVIQEEIIIHG